MVVATDDTSPDRIVIELDPGGLMELSGLVESFSGLTRYYERHFAPTPQQLPPRLYVSRLETGSVVAELVPYIVLVGALVHTMDGTMIVVDFTKRLAAAVRAFADAGDNAAPPTPTADPAPAISPDDAKDIQAFVRPLAGKKGAMLRIKHARLEKRDGTRSLVAEYSFDEASINRAAVNTENALQQREGAAHLLPAANAQPSASSRERTEVMLFFDQASQGPGKARGRTADKAIIPAISDRSLPVYFLQSLQRLKDQMVRGEVNPFRSTSIVDVMVSQLDGRPAGYTITNVHEIVPRD